MSTTLTLPPKTQLTGTFQDVAPVPTDGSIYTRPVQLWAQSMAYWAGDANAGATQTGPAVASVLPSTAPIQVVATAEYAWVDTALATHNMPYPTVPAEFGGAIQVNDLIVVDISEQEAGTTAAPITHTGFSSRGSFQFGTPWVPRHTRLFRMTGTGGETGTFAVTWAVARRVHAYVRVIRGVDPFVFFDVGAAAVAQGQGGNPDPASNGPLTVGGSLFEVVLAGNNYPDGYDLWDGTEAPPGMTVNFENTDRTRYFAGCSMVGGDAGTSFNPGQFEFINPDNWSVITDVYKAKLYSNATLILLSAVADETATTTLSGSPPTIPALNTLQRITSVLTAGTFTLTFGGNTTAAINWNDSAATIQTRLRALASIGAAGCNVTGGPINSNPVVVEFTGALAGADQALITTSTGSVTVVETQVGTPGYTFTFEGNINVPQTGGTYQPQIHVWSLQPGGTWPTGRLVTQTISSHGANKTYAAELLAYSNLRAGNPVGDVLGSFVADPAESVAIFGSITPVVRGSLILAALAKAKTDGSNYSATSPYEAGAPYASDPARYYNSGRVAADGMTLQTWTSTPAASGSAETLSSVSWAGLENYTDTLLELVPVSSAGTKTVIEVLKEQSQASWLELANCMGSLYEVVELDLAGMPSDAKFSSISFTFSHESDVRGALRVVPVGIKADGSFVAGQERRVGGYQLDAVNTPQSVTTGEWFELADGSRLADYSRVGVAIFATRRHSAVTTHRLYWLTASLTFETGGPVVANVLGPPSPGAGITWDFSSGGGLAQRAIRALVIQGGNADLDDPSGFLDYYFSDFTAALGSEWEIYDGAGNAGFGVRRASAVTITADGTASGNSKLRINASNGTGGDTGKIVSGGIKLKKPITYGQIEFRYQSSGDANSFMSPVVLLWPAADATRFPASNGAPPEWPAGGEIDIVENFANRSTLNPIEHHLHRLKLGVVPPFDPTEDEKQDFSTALAGTTWRKVVLNWLPSGISVSVDNGAFQVLSADPAWIPSWPMEVCIQFDCWVNGTLSATRTMDVDYLVVRRVASTLIYPKNPLDPQSGEVVADSGWVYGANRRSFLFEDQPLGRGDQTFLVKARALMYNGVEIESAWGLDEVNDISGSPPAPGTQAANPRYNSATGGVEVPLVTPAGVTRAWLARSADQGASWSLVGPFDVSPSADVVVIDYGAPLARSRLRYMASFDSGPNTETTVATTVGSGDIATKLDTWWLMVPDDPALNTKIEVSRFEWEEPRDILTAGDASGAIVVDSGKLPDRIGLTLRVRSAADRAKVTAALDARLTMRLVNILGEEWRVRLASGVSRQLLRWAPDRTDFTPLKDAHEITIELQEVV